MAETVHQLLARSVPVPEEQLPIAIERAGVYAVHNRYLRLLLTISCLVILALTAAWYGVSRSYAEIRPIVIRINEVGEPIATQYGATAYQIAEPEVRYFLSRFVIDHYSRMRATRRDAFQRQLFFLDQSHSRAAMDEETRARSIGKFLVSADDEVDVRILNVAIQELQHPPYKAQVDFEKVYLAAADHLELKRERFVGQFQFQVLDSVPNSFVTVNPLGLVITYFREDQAFEK